METMKPIAVAVRSLTQSGASEPKSRNLTAAPVVARQISVLFSSYRKDDYSDAEGFVAQLGVILSDYPEHVVLAVTHPLTGIQRRLKFPPSLAEIVEACEDQMKPFYQRKFINS